MDDARRYLNDIVEPTIKDFEDNRTSVRHAVVACIVAFHTVDYIGRAIGKFPAHLRQVFRNESGDFGVVDDVAHAVKHVSVGPRENPDLKAVEIISRPPAFWGQAVWDLSSWDDADGGVTLDRERDVDLLKTLLRTTQFLRSKIA
jgi:hypothetical protein